MPYFYTESQAWVPSGFEFSIDTSAAKWGDRAVSLSFRIHSTCGQPGSARIVEVATGEVIAEFGMGCPDTWNTGTGVARAGLHRYRLEVHGHVGWSPNLHLVEGTVTASN